MIPNYAAASGEIDDESDSWDETASRWWSSWSKFPAIDCQFPLSVIQSEIATTWWHDGELFIYKTFSKESGRPRIQLIEGHRVGTPPDMRELEGHAIVDGIEFQPDSDGRPSGRPIRYWVRTDVGQASLYGGYVPALFRSGDYKPIQAGQIIHLFKPTRPGMFRGLPMVTGRMNDLHDLEDMQLLEKKAAKDAAEITNVVTNKTGEAPISSSRRQKWQIQSQDANGNPIVKSTPLFYEVTMGGRTVYQMNGEKFEQFKSDRPSIATRDYWDYLVRKVAGPMWPLMLPQSVQGTQFRAFMEVANTYFRMHTTILAAVMREIYVWALGWGVDYDRSLDGAPKEWWHVDVVPPRAVTVDIGRNSTALLNELKAGTRTYKSFCGELGHDWKDVLRQKAIEAAFINRLVHEYDVTGRQIAELAQESLRVTEKVTETSAEIEEENPDPNKTAPEPEKTIGNKATQPLIVNIDNSTAGKRKVTFNRGEDGRIEGAEIEERKISFRRDQDGTLETPEIEES
jgi:capsid protein